MDKTRSNYPDIAPSGPTYSRVVRSGNLVFIAGCTARGTEGQGKPVMEQLRVTLDRIIRIVEAEGGAPKDITKITTFDQHRGVIQRPSVAVDQSSSFDKSGHDFTLPRFFGWVDGLGSPAKSQCAVQTS